MGNQKTVHAIRGQGWVAECTDEPPNHGKCMSSGQALVIHRTRARVRPIHHQPVPSQYRSGGSWVKGKWRYDLAVGRRGSLFWGSHSNSFGGNVLLGWHTTQKRKGWVGTDRCMPWGIMREDAHLVPDEIATVNRQTKKFYLFGNGEWHSQHR